MANNRTTKVTQHPLLPLLRAPAFRVDRGCSMITLGRDEGGDNQDNKGTMTQGDGDNQEMAATTRPGGKQRKDRTTTTWGQEGGEEWGNSEKDRNNKDRMVGRGGSHHNARDDNDRVRQRQPNKTQ